MCGWTLARAHARSGDPVAIAAYLGEDDQFDRSIADFAKRYADQNELDYQAFAEAIRSGRLQALAGAWAPGGRRSAQPGARGGTPRRCLSRSGPSARVGSSP